MIINWYKQITRYSVGTSDRMCVKRYCFVCFAKNISKNVNKNFNNWYSQNIFDESIKSETNAFKTGGANGDLKWNMIA